MFNQCAKEAFILVQLLKDENIRKELRHNR